MSKLNLAMAVALTAAALALPSASEADDQNFTFTKCIVGTSSTRCLRAGSYQHVQVQDVDSSNSIACSWGSTPVLNDGLSIQMAASQSALWGPATRGVPHADLNCIASGANTQMYVEFN